MEDEEFVSNNENNNPSPYKVHQYRESQCRKGMHQDMNCSVASSSNAGSSGWSSSAGISSLNTSDSAEYFGSSLAAIGAASNISKRYNEKRYPIISGSDSSLSDRYVVCVNMTFIILLFSW